MASVNVTNQIVYHRHHIIPKHVGGTDDQSNLIKVNIPYVITEETRQKLSQSAKADWAKRKANA